MNENHHPDKAISEEIDAVLHGSKSNHDLLRTLRDLTPQAEKAFQENLEEQLMARLQNTESQTQTKEEIMRIFNQKQKRGNRSRLPITLVAAVIAIAFVGGLLFFVQGVSNSGLQDGICAYDGSAETHIVQEGETLRSIATTFDVDVANIANANCLNNIDTIEVGSVLTIPEARAAGQVSNPRGVIVASGDIAYGETITEDMLSVEYFASREINAVFPFCCIDYIVGRIAAEPINSGTIIEERMLGNFDEASANLVDEESRILVLASREIEMNETITEDMLMAVSIDSDDAWAIAEENRGVFYYSQAELAVGQRASVLIHAYEPITSENVDNTSCEGECMAVLPPGRVAVALPLYDETPLYMPIGQEVDVITAIRFVDVGDEFQAIGGNDEEASGAEVQVVLSTTVTDAILLYVGDVGDTMVMTLAVSEQDAVVLMYLAEANIPMRIVPHVETDETITNSIDQLVYPMTEDGFAIVSIPLNQVSGRTENIGDVYDIQFFLPPRDSTFESSSALGTAQVGTVWRVGDVLTLNDSTLLYLGQGTEEYPNPQGEDGGLFMAITVDASDAWLLDSYVQSGARFSLEPASTSSTASTSTQDYAFAFPIEVIETIPFGVQAGDVLDILISTENNVTELILNNVEVLYIGNDLADSRITGVLVIPDEASGDEGYVVVRLGGEAYERVNALIQRDAIRAITLRPVNQEPSVMISGIVAPGNIDGEGITIHNEGPLVVVTGWTLQDEDGNMFEFGEFLLFSNAEHTVYTGNGQNTPIASFWGLGSSIIDAAEMISLMDADGNLQAQYTAPRE